VWRNKGRTKIKGGYVRVWGMGGLDIECVWRWMVELPNGSCFGIVRSDKLDVHKSPRVGNLMSE
jgi:hypothetical protein